LLALLSFLTLPATTSRGWGRIVNVSSAIAGPPATMPRANAYASSNAALEAHAVSRAAEVDGTGWPATPSLPGSVDTAMQAWIRGQDPARVGQALARALRPLRRAGHPYLSDVAAAALVRRLASEDTGRVREVTDR